MLNISNNIVLGTYPFLIYTLITFWIIIVLHLILFFNLTCTSLWGYGTDLCEDWWFMMRNHSGVFTVKRDRTCVIVEGLFRLHHMIVQFFNSTLKYAAKVPWNQVSSYGWKSRQKRVVTYIIIKVGNQGPWRMLIGYQINLCLTPKKLIIKNFLTISCQIKR